MILYATTVSFSQITIWAKKSHWKGEKPLFIASSPDKRSLTLCASGAHLFSFIIYLLVKSTECGYRRYRTIWTRQKLFKMSHTRGLRLDASEKWWFIYSERHETKTRKTKHVNSNMKYKISKLTVNHIWGDARETEASWTGDTQAYNIITRTHWARDESFYSLIQTSPNHRRS